MRELEHSILGKTTLSQCTKPVNAGEVPGHEHSLISTPINSKASSEASGLQLQDAKNDDPLVSKDSDTPEVAPEVTPVSLETNAPEDLSFLDPTQDSISPT